MKKAVARSTRTLYVTNEFLQSRYPSSGEQAVVSNVEITSHDPAIMDKRLRHIETNESALTFGMIAALFHKEKGIDVAIRALSIARRQAPNIKLKILGPGDQEPWREMAQRAGVEDSVEFCGSLPRGDAVLEWIDGLDVYIQASFQEGLPRALIEAMSRGCPALASSAGGTYELVPGSCLHRPGDHQKLSEHMVRALDKSWREENARLNFERSKIYAKAHLDRERESFWKKLRDSRPPH